MDSCFYLITYDGMGGHPVLSFTAPFLLADSPVESTNAVREIAFFAHIPNLIYDPSLQEMHAKFVARRSSLPLAGLDKRSRTVEFAFVADLGYAEDVETCVNGDDSVALFAKACRHIEVAIQTATHNPALRDLLDWPMLTDYISGRIDDLPTTATALSVVLNRLQENDRKSLRP